MKKWRRKAFRRPRLVRAHVRGIREVLGFMTWRRYVRIDTTVFGCAITYTFGLPDAEER